MKNVMSIAVVALLMVGAVAIASETNETSSCQVKKAEKKEACCTAEKKEACCTAEKKCDKCTDEKMCEACAKKAEEAKKAEATE